MAIVSNAEIAKFILVPGAEQDPSLFNKSGAYYVEWEELTQKTQMARITLYTGIVVVVVTSLGANFCDPGVTRLVVKGVCALSLGIVMGTGRELLKAALNFKRAMQLNNKCKICGYRFCWTVTHFNKFTHTE